MKRTITIIIIAIIIVVIGIYLYSSQVTAPTINSEIVGTTSTSTSGTISSSTSDSTTTTAETTSVKVFYVAVEDPNTGTPIGCGDGVVAVSVPVPATTTPLSASLNALFSNHQKTIGQSGLYNALSESRLAVDSLAINDGNAVVKLSGTVSLGGVCDDPRFVAQIKQTVMQFSTIKSATITINGKSLESYGSEKGE